jgi:preprotein translocase subunit SecE
MARQSSRSNQRSSRGPSFRFFTDIIGELRRVTWPSREETMRLSIMVIAVAAVIGAFLGVIDIGFGRLFSVILG